MESKRLRILVSGRVTGVGFRYATVGQGRRLLLVGEVKNTPDHEVEIIAEGDRESLEKLAEWAKTGPALAHVLEVKTFWETPIGEFSSFKIAKY